MYHTESGEVQHLYDDHGLFFSLTGAGQSYGIVTEFLYKIYPKPETLPILAMVYLENPYDVRKLEKLAMDGRYHVTLFYIYMFKDLQRVPELTVSYLPFHLDSTWLFQPLNFQCNLQTWSSGFLFPIWNLKIYFQFFKAQLRRL